MIKQIKTLTQICLAITILLCSTSEAKASRTLFPLSKGDRFMQQCTYSNKGANLNEYTLIELLRVMKDLEAYKSAEILNDAYDNYCNKDILLDLSISDVWETALEKAINDSQDNYSYETFEIITDRQNELRGALRNAEIRIEDLKALRSAIYYQKDLVFGEIITAVDNENYDDVMDQLMIAKEFETFIENESYRWLKLFHAYLFKEDNPL